ncbi:MAG TPA: cell division protein ZapA [Caulobacteraceae bacterium]|nr:cell division protein ZapA [Caulobacteraceae bacterium]
MAQVTIHINGKPYAVGCEDGQERRLTELAAIFDHQVRQVSADVGQLGETRLFLMGALLLADELHETREKLRSAQEQVAGAEAEHTRLEMKAVSIVESAAKRIEKLASGGE